MTDASNPRTATVSRKTKETDIAVELTLDGSGRADIATGLPFLDHMLTALTLHARFDLRLQAKGDLEIDDHHTAEDCALTLGQALRDALGDRRGVARFGSAHVPLDEALTRAVIDLSGRPWAEVELAFRGERLGTCRTENLTHFCRSFATAAHVTLHLDVLRGENDHHKAESAFKALAVALRMAVRRDAMDSATGDVPSTKGTL